MRAGIIGWPSSGRDAIFTALTSLERPPFGTIEPRLGEAIVPDERLDALAGQIYKPQKLTLAKLEFYLPHPQGLVKDVIKECFEKVRESDVLLAVLKNFKIDGEEEPNPKKAADDLEAEMIFSDYLVVEKRLERLAEEIRRGKQNDPEEKELLLKAKDMLEKGEPLRSEAIYASSPKLKGFAFLSAKPILAIINNADTDESEPQLNVKWPQVMVKGSVEEEVAQLDEEDRQDFLKDYNLPQSAATRIIKEVYRLMGLISYFTVGEIECRVWTIRDGDTALEAAGVIHSDIQKGFIRAEVVSYQDCIDAGGLTEAKKKGTFRLEGKTYLVKDGDIVHFRFNI